MRTCKTCKEKFEPQYNSVQMCCSYLCAIVYTQKQKEKNWKKEKVKRKKDLMTLQDWIKIAQTHFNKYIRLRDKGQPCISCQNPNPKKINAGHFRSVGSCPELRFNELNVHLQCEYCNTYQHGNLLEYRKNLILKLGEETVEELERYHEPQRYSIEDVKKIIEIYKKKVKELE